MIGTRWGRILVVVALMLPSAVDVHALGEESHERLGAPPQERSLEPWEAERGRHLAAGFAGWTWVEGGGGFTAGVEYEFHFHRLMGIGVLGQYAGGDVKTTTLGLPFYVHPRNAARLLFMPGVAMKDEDNVDVFVFRVGILYDIFINQFTITPTLYGDIIDWNVNPMDDKGTWATIAGVEIGYTF